MENFTAKAIDTILAAEGLYVASRRLVEDGSKRSAFYA